MPTIDQLCKPSLFLPIKGLSQTELESFVLLTDDELEQLASARTNKHTFLERIFATVTIGSMNLSTYFNKVRDLIIKANANGLYNNPENSKEDATLLTHTFLSFPSGLTDYFKTIANDVGLSHLFKSEEGKVQYLNESTRSQFSMRKKRCLACGFEEVKHLKYEPSSSRNRASASQAYSGGSCSKQTVLAHVGFLKPQGTKRQADSELDGEPLKKIKHQEGNPKTPG